jgi:hypothetical protein
MRIRRSARSPLPTRRRTPLKGSRKPRSTVRIIGLPSMLTCILPDRALVQIKRTGFSGSKRKLDSTSSTMEALPRLLTRKRRSLERFSASRLEAVKRAGGSSALLQYEDVYRDRLAQIPFKAQSSGQVIGAESITRSPTSKPVRTRASSNRRASSHISISKFALISIPRAYVQGRMSYSMRSAKR